MYYYYDDLPIYFAWLTVVDFALAVDVDEAGRGGYCVDVQDAWV